MDYCLGIDELFHYLKATPTSRCINEGQAVLNAGHLVTCGIKEKYHQKVNLIAFCLKSSGLNDSLHEIKGTFKWNSACVVSVENVSCSCKAGQSSACKHAAALLFLCSRQSILDFQEFSCTDLEAYWKKEKMSALENYKPTPLIESPCIMNIRPVRNSSKLERVPISKEKNEEIFKKLSAAAPDSSLAKHRKRKREIKPNVQAEATSEGTDDFDLLGIFENARDSEVIKGLAKISPSQECCKKVYQSIERSDYIEVARESFRDKLLWKFERKFRITGSRCYGLLSYRGNDWHSKSVKYFWPKGFTNKFTRYGLETEAEARAAYIKRNGYQVKETGVIISEEQPWLAYSPDGVVLKDGNPSKLLEIKCPYIGKTIRAIEFVNKCDFIIIDNDRVTIKKKHTYYAQVQLGMAILNLEECDFIVYSSCSKDFLNLNIKFDKEYVEYMLNKLQIIYFNEMLHEICSNEK